MMTTAMVKRLDSVSKTKVGRRDWWAAKVDEWRQSGESQASFCRRIGLKVDQFRRWKRKLDLLSSTRDLVELPYSLGMLGRSTVFIHYEDVKIEVNEGTDLGVVRRVLLALRGQ